METEVIREVEPQGTANVVKIGTQLLKSDRKVFCEVWQDLEIEDRGVHP